MSEALHVRVPGSTSNLGPGFDTLGLAVDRYLDLVWEAGERGTVIQEGERPPHPLGNLLAEGYAATGLPRAGRLRVRSEIPVGRGLGSSAALLVGLRVLRELIDAGCDGDLDPERLRNVIDRRRLVAEVAAREGHPDNAAPSVYGGLVTAADTDAGIRVVPLSLSVRIGWGWAAPSVAADTGRMRAALPDRVERSVAVRTVQRLAHLLPALATGDGEALAWAMADEIHVPARLPLIPGAQEAVEAAHDAGAWSCTISGAGSGLIAAAPPERVESVVEAMHAAFRASDPEPELATAFVVHPDLSGVRWGRGLTPPADHAVAPPTRRG
ncbi:MAG: homoserine kinase [Longimicrobiales bacterium]|nr:homoserine kinase [Longimicrobiales bacterium]